MAKLQKTFIVTSDSSNENKGNNVPPYFDNFSPSNWYFGDKSYYYNIVDGVVSGNRIYVQYGTNQAPWVTAKFYYYALNIIEEEELEDRSIRAIIEVKAGYFVSRRSTYQGGGGVQVKHRVKVNGITKYSYDGNTLDEFSNRVSATPETFEIIVPPEQISQRSALNIVVTYPNGEFEGSNIYVGVGLRNPNSKIPPYYVPMAIRKNNTWKDLNSNNGFIEKRENGIWEDYSQENKETERQINKGKNRIRQNGNWKQLPEMKGGGI